MSETKFVPPNPLKTAVLFLIFNRLDTTRQVFEAIRQAKPPRLYIAADGARESKEGEAEKVNAVRDYVMSRIDWDCEVKTLFREKNLGCKYAVSGAIDWFFENEEMGIILEDDCLPSQSFFWFCEELLGEYKEDYRISMITGTSYLFNEIKSDDDYFFSKYMSIWGWATWSSRWKKYDISMNDFPLVLERNLLESVYFWDKNIKEIFIGNFKMAYENKIDAWDYQWNYKCVMESGYCITPFKNLVSNIGIEGTRASSNSPFIKMKKIELVDIKEIKSSLPVLQTIDIDKILFYNVFYRFGGNRQFIKILRRFKLLNFAKYLKEIING